MRYIYYTVSIVALASLLLVFFLRDNTLVEVSRTAIAVNDRKISEAELERLMEKKPHDMAEEQYIDSIVMNELLIQEAIRRDIHKEEAFRRSVENFYEQSLVKILLDRQYADFEPIVTAAEIEKYRELSGSRVVIAKHVYADRKAAEEKRGVRQETISTRFAFLSDRLKFICLNLGAGESSKPMETKNGAVVYTLRRIEPLNKAPALSEEDTEAVRAFIREQKKERLYDRWSEELKAEADIWRQK
jgi:hypothetical protein